MAYSVIDKVYTIFIDVMTGSSNGYGKPTFYNTDSHTSFIELTVTNGSKEFNMTEFSYMFTVEKPDGTKYTNEYTTQDKSKLVIPVDAQMISCTGNCNAQLYVNKEVDGVNKTLTMVEFNYTVYKGLHEGLISESVDFDNVYVKILNKLDYIINNGADLTGDQAAQLAYAYQHSKSPHAPANIVETMHTEIGEAIDAHHKKVTLGASKVGGYEGTDITIKPSNEGLTKDIVIKGRTLQNLFPSESTGMDTTSTTTLSNGVITCNPTPNNYCYVWETNSNYKRDTVYTVVVDILENTLVKSSSVAEGQCCIIIGASPQSVFENGRQLNVLGQKGRLVVALRTRKDFSTITDNRGVRAYLNNSFDSGTLKYTMMVLEGDYTTPDAHIPPYFEGIKSVGESKNLFNPKNGFSNMWTNGVDISSDDTGKKYSIIVENIIEGSTYCVRGNGFNRLSYAYLSGANKVLAGGTLQQVVNGFVTPLKAPIGAVKLLCYLIVDGFDENRIDDYMVQVERGSLPTDYTPYGASYTIPIGSYGKNLFDYDSIESTSPSVVKNNANGFTLSDYANDARVSFKKMFPRAEVGKTYSYSATLDTHGQEGTAASGSIGFYDRNSSEMLLYVTIGESFVVSERINKSDIYIYGVVGHPTDLNNIQLEEGAVATAYEPYQEDVKEIIIKEPLRNNDIVSEKGESIEVLRNTIKYDITGDEVWIQYPSDESFDCVGFYCQLSKSLDAKFNESFICNNFKGGTKDLFPGSLARDEEAIFVEGRSSEYSPSYIKISISKSKLATPDVDGLKKWLKDNPTTVLYQLATPSKEIAKGDNKLNLRTSKGTSYVSSVCGIKPQISFDLDFVPMTTDAKQYCTADGNKNFILPDVTALQDSNALEIHLFVKMKANGSLTFPSSILWDDITKMNEVSNGSVAEFIFTYIKTADGGSWLGTVVPHK